MFSSRNALIVLFVVAGAREAIPQKQPYTTWSDYGGAADSMQYSALRQIDKTNVNRLELAWSYRVPDRGGSFGFNPLIVEGVMYVEGQNNAIVALDATTGKPIWSHPVEGDLTIRGINYWQSKNRSDRRLIFGTGNYLHEISARTGIAINTFGDDGRVNMRVGMPRTSGFASATPGRVFENLILVGSNVGYAMDKTYNFPSGDLHAYDVISGRLIWTFHTIPHPGEFGYETWPKDAWTYAGGANTWGEISIDEKRGIAYFPTASPRYNFYGADRIGANLFGDCLLALDARTGKRLWHFQAVHHDLWDYDLTTAPKLLTVRHNGRMVDVVAQATKFGFLYVFDRVTGEPLWPIEERPVPRSDVPGEKAWPTQPFPTKPPPFTRQKFTVDDINPYVNDAERAHLKDLLLKARNEGLFTPPSTRNTVDMPGEGGGSNWGGAAADPQTGMLYVRSHDLPTMHILSEWPEPKTMRGALSDTWHGMFQAVSKLRSAGPTPEQRGYSVFAQHCATCHGAERSGVTSPKVLGAEGFRNLVRTGQGGMPGFSETTVTPQDLDALAAYLVNPAAGTPAGQAVHAVDPSTLPPLPGQKRYSTPWGDMYTSNGLPAISPPWGQLTAYDLNEGTIKWQVPLGIVPQLAARGIRNTGNVGVSRNGPAVTAGGLIFIGSGADRTVHAYDKDTGKILWEKELGASPEGLVAVYEAEGRQYVAFCASGPAAAQGYYVFALPKLVPASKKK
jgi:quinoprotein glucose dehydrogenase